MALNQTWPLPSPLLNPVLALKRNFRLTLALKLTLFLPRCPDPNPNPDPDPNSNLDPNLDPNLHPNLDPISGPHRGQGWAGGGYERTRRGGTDTVALRRILRFCCRRAPSAPGLNRCMGGLGWAVKTLAGQPLSDLIR